MSVQCPKRKAGGGVYVVSKKDMTAYVIPNFELSGLDSGLNSTYIAGFLFLVLNHFFFLDKTFHGK